jgi:hypothetical protein
MLLSVFSSGSGDEDRYILVDGSHRMYVLFDPRFENSASMHPSEVKIILLRANTPGAVLLHVSAGG